VLNLANAGIEKEQLEQIIGNLHIIIEFYSKVEKELLTSLEQEPSTDENCCDNIEEGDYKNHHLNPLSDALKKLIQ
jgi:hypothetical protein